MNFTERLVSRHGQPFGRRAVIFVLALGVMPVMSMRKADALSDAQPIRKPLQSMSVNIG